MSNSFSLKCGYAAMLLAFALNGSQVCAGEESAPKAESPKEPAKQEAVVSAVKPEAASSSQARSNKDVILAPAQPVASPPPAPVAVAPVMGGAAPAAVTDVSAGAGPNARQIGFGSNLANLGLHLLRAQSAGRGNAQANAVVSPYSAANALGMLHAGAVGQTASEIAGLFEAGGVNGKLLRKQMKQSNAMLAKPADGVELSYANRIWLDSSVVSDISPVFKATVADIYRGDGVTIAFSDSNSAANTINKWVSDNTRGKIPQLLTPTALSGTTKAVVTNAVYFKGRWQKAFDAAATRNLPFYSTPNAPVSVPTMTGVVPVRLGVVDGLRIYELPYGAGDFVLLVALPVDSRHTLDALEQDTDGSDIVHWLQALQPATVQLELPKFRIDPVARSLKPALVAAGMKAAFDSHADFSGLAAKTPLVVDDVFQAAGIVVDEQGAEATAATAVVMRSKSIGSVAPIPLHKIDRPFMFVLAHKPSATPLFVGKIARPE